MASVESETPTSETTVSAAPNRGSVENAEKGREEVDLNGTTNRAKKNGISFYLPKIGFRCFRVQRDEKGNFDLEVVNSSGDRWKPTHLLIMVNGLVGSPEDWKYAAEQFLKAYPEDIVVHCSKCNHSTLTFHGVDVMGGRLAEEIVSVIERHPDVRKISFVCHSLGGLIARYAIAKLYEQDVRKEDVKVNGECSNHGWSRDQSSRREEELKGKIAGLEPVNFITCATPHLGSRGHKQVPMCCGFYVLEKVAVCTSLFFGKTGRHLFLLDNGKRPLLLQMAGDREDLKFLSALRSFRRRVIYANVRYDNIVGWSTSSIRRRKELPKLKDLSGDSKYPYIVNVETAKLSSPQLSEAKAKGHKKTRLEEEMIKGLSSVGWDRVDVDFHESKQRQAAHLTIQVNRYCVNSDGASVIQHMIDNFLL